MSSPKWLSIARDYLGEREIAGKRSNPVISGFFQTVNGSLLGDETPWCAAFVGACLTRAGLPDTDSFLARSYLDYGAKLTKPRLGCIAVFKRGNSTWQGHVGFFLREIGDRVEILGGNQGDAVSIARYRKSQLLGYRWPDDVEIPAVDQAVRRSLRSVQEQLKRLGYFEVGRIDGIWGTKTRAAVLAFRADNGLPLEPNATDKAFLSALFVTARRREVAPERATAGLADLRRDGSRTIAATDAAKVTGIGSGALVVAGKIAEGLADAGAKADQVNQAIGPLQTLLGFVAENWWILVVGLAALGVFFAWRAAQARLDDHRTGKTG